ncbi:hypothetical protein BgiMline_030949 [Biomphalaria glabrata]
MMSKLVISDSMSLNQSGTVKGQAGANRQVTDNQKPFHSKRSSDKTSERADLLASRVTEELKSASSCVITSGVSDAMLDGIKLNQAVLKNGRAVLNPHLKTVQADESNVEAPNAVNLSTQELRRGAKKRTKACNATAKAKTSIRGTPRVLRNKRRSTKPQQQGVKPGQSCNKEGENRTKHDETRKSNIIAGAALCSSVHRIVPRQNTRSTATIITKRDFPRKLKKQKTQTDRIFRATLKPSSEYFKHRNTQNSKSFTTMSALRNRPSWNSSTATSPFHVNQHTSAVVLAANKTNNFTCQRSKSDHNKRKTNGAVETHNPASYSPVSFLHSSSSKLDRLESKTRIRGGNLTGVIRTRIIRKIKASGSMNSSAHKATKSGSRKLTLNPCDDGNLKLNPMLAVESKDRSNGDSLDTRNFSSEMVNSKFTNSTNAALSLASCPELRGSSSIAGAATSVSDCKTYGRKLSSKYNLGQESSRNSRVHVTRIRRRSAQHLPRDSNNNADAEEASMDATEAKMTESKGNEKSNDDDKSSSSESSSTPRHSSGTVSSTSFEGETSASTLPDSMAKKKMSIQEEKKKGKKVLKKKVAKKKMSLLKEYKDVQKSTAPPCPLFAGWDFESKLDTHQMKTLPLECDLVGQLSKRAKAKVWEAIGKPINITNWVQKADAPTSTHIDLIDDLKAYLAKNSIEEFVQQLTHSVLLAPNESAIGTLIEQGQLFKQRLKYDTDTDAFLKYVFEKLGDNPIAFPSATKSEQIFYESNYEPSMERPIVKQPIDIVIGIPGVIHDSRLSSARSDVEKINLPQPEPSHESLM